MYFMLVNFSACLFPNDRKVVLGCNACLPLLRWVPVWGRPQQPCLLLSVVLLLLEVDWVTFLTLVGVLACQQDSTLFLKL